MKPPRLNQGDVIGLISPSSEIKSFPRRLERGINSLQEAGYSVTMLGNALNKAGNEAGTPVERARDINNAFLNDQIKAIMATSGGYTSITILEYLDYKVIRNHPKIFIGFSDITALLLSVYTKTNLVTFHGPTVLPSFGAYEGVHPFTLEYLKRIVASPDQTDIAITDFPVYSEDNSFWDKEDNQPKVLKKSTGLITLFPGEATGKLLGGNLETLCSMLGTSFFPDIKGKILFIEECGGLLERTKRDLKRLELLGIFSEITGFIYGRNYRYQDGIYPNNLEMFLKTLMHKYRIPSLFNIPIGHTEPKYTLPIGVEAKLDSNLQQLTLLENAVT